jgi:signal peptidase I
MLSGRVKWLAGVAILVAGTYLLSPFRIGVVCGDSMSPTLQSGRLFVIDRNAYRRETPQRGDVVVFRHEGATYVKRVAAVGGDRFLLYRFSSGGADQPIPQWQAPLLQRLGRMPWGPPGKLVQEHLHTGFFYVLGDHAARSQDSRDFGPIALRDIQGKLLFVPEHEPDLEMASGPTSPHP